LYGELAREEKGNFVCSPHGVAEVLGMAEAGSAGRTRAELRRAIAPEGVEDVAGYFAGKRGDWEGASGEEVVKTANSVWVASGTCGVDEETARVLEEAYRADVREADFSDAAEVARQVNEWASEATEGRVRRVADEGMGGEESGFVAVNATCFGGKWASPFWTTDTRKAVFRAEDGSEGTVEMMFQETSARVAVREAGAMLCLPYEGGELEFRVWLPRSREAGSLAALERALAEEPGEWEAWEAAARQRERVGVHLPKFRAEWESGDLSAALRALGVESAFGEGAEFPGFGGGRLGRGGGGWGGGGVWGGWGGGGGGGVAQSAVLEVDETGTRAAAATAGFVTLGDVPKFRADRPFLYAVAERATGRVLFMGRMARAPGSGRRPGG
jgi:serpin B